MEKIEVLMATYNGKSYIREQIDSILNQTYKSWHLTISDDGSTDGTDRIVDEYTKEYPDKITRVYSQTRFGNAKDHFFWLSENCTSEYMLYSDQDDVFAPDKMSRLMDAMQNAEEKWGGGMPILVFSDQTVVDEKLSVLAPSLMRYQKQYFEHFDYRSILMQNVVTGGAMMINRALVSLVLQCTDLSQVIMHDWWMAAVAARFGEIVYIDEPLGAYRQHEHNSVGAKNVGSLSHILYKLGHTREISCTLMHKKAQASVFERSYAPVLEETDHVFLRRFARRRSGPVFYLKNRMFVHGFFRLVGMIILG